MRVLFIGDVVGRPGRRVLATRLSGLRRAHAADVVIANGENSAGGVGLSGEAAAELFAAGVDILTGGNHVWHNREVYDLLDSEPRIVRPANFPPGVPGRGAAVVQTPAGHKVGVLNLQGRVFMQEIDDPFRIGRQQAAVLRGNVPVVIVDMHAEATSEKIAMGWYLDGRVSAVVGTHTHVQTADERILPEGTAYISDVGMTGPRDGVIGMAREGIIERFLTQLPVRFQVASGPAQINGVLIDVAVDGRAQSIERIALIDES